MMNKDFMGAGMKFPPEVDSSTGRFKLSSYEDKIKESIYLIVRTHQGERPCLPKFGGSLSRYVFSGTDATTLNLLSHSIQKTLYHNEKRIKNVVVRAEPDRGQTERLNIDIRYVLAENDLPGNLVFPFYIEGIEEKDNESE